MLHVRVPLAHSAAHANQIAHGVEHEPQTPQQPQDKLVINAPDPVIPVTAAAPNVIWGISLKWVMTVGGLVAVVLALNVAFMCYMYKRLKRRRRAGRGRYDLAYASVKPT
eukprot:1083460_1